MVHLIAGLVLLALGGWGIVTWWADFGAFLRGLMPVLFVLAGLAAIGAGHKARQSSDEQDEDDTEGSDTERTVYPREERMAG